MVPSPSRQRPKSGTEANLFRGVLHRSFGGARFFQHVNNDVHLGRAAWHDGCDGERSTETGSGHGWSVVPSRQRPPTSWTWSWTEANFFRGVLHRSFGGARFFRHVKNDVYLVRAAWHDGGDGERHQSLEAKAKNKQKREQMAHGFFIKSN